jgi:hypothetical protein
MDIELGGNVMDKRTMEFKLLSYKQALRKAHENGDKSAVKSWTEEITALQKQIKETI